MTLDPRIAEILKARKDAGIVINKTITAQSIPAIPQAQGGFQGPAKADAPQGAPVPTPTSETVEVPVSDSEITTMFSEVRAAVVDLIAKTVPALADRKLSVPEALGLAPELRNLLSLAVSQVLPQIKGRNARDLVILFLPALITEFIAPHLPMWLRGFLTAATIKVLIKGLQTAYELWIKPRIGQK